MEQYGFEKAHRELERIGESECFFNREKSLMVTEIPKEGADLLLSWLTENREGLNQWQERIWKEQGCEFLLLVWREQEEERLLFFSYSRRVRALEFLDYLIADFGLLKGDANCASGRISSVILKVQMAGVDLADTMEYFLKQSQSYFEDCDWIEAGTYGSQYASEIRRMQLYTKKQIPWAYVKSLDVTYSGGMFTMKSLENESGLTLQAAEETYIMIGCRGEIYDITREKFQCTYQATEEKVDIFAMMLDFLPAVETVPEGEYIGLDEIAHLCYPKTDNGIYAMELKQRTKVFPVNKDQEYFLGRPGDYLAVRADDFSDIYIIQKDIFLQTYEEIVYK